ncbi:MAG: ubiquitin family protein [Methanomassiliicoccaceae archaeon]|nr:ubiquitin family protein [Methanomassiliicoccaceae archaeon]
MTVRITVINTMNNSSIRMELESYESVEDIIDTAAEYWGKDAGAYVLRKGSKLLNKRQSIDEINLREGDIIEMIPDPEGGN